MYKVLGSSLLKDEGEVVGGTQPLQWECFKQLQSHWHPISKASHLKESDWGAGYQFKGPKDQCWWNLFLTMLGSRSTSDFKISPQTQQSISYLKLWNLICLKFQYFLETLHQCSSFRFWSSLDFQIRETPFTFEALMHLEIKISTIWAKVMRDKIKISYYF